MGSLFRGEDLQALYKKYGTNRITACIACGETPENFSYWHRDGAFPVDQCGRCGLVFMNPQLGELGLREYYSNYIGKRRLNSRHKMELRQLQYKQDADLIRRFKKRGVVLDVGCNGGFFLNALGEGFEKHGTELDEYAVQYARQHFPDIACNIRSGSIEAANYPNGQFDLVMLRGVIEHCPSPIDVVREVSRVTRPGGYCYICATPNVTSVGASLYREKWTLFHPVQHLWHFSPETLEIIFNKFEMRLVWKEFPYLSTPYENFQQDIREIVAFLDGEDSSCPAFFENMMSLVFKKESFASSGIVR